MVQQVGYIFSLHFPLELIHFCDEKHVAGNTAESEELGRLAMEVRLRLRRRQLRISHHSCHFSIIIFLSLPFQATGEPVPRSRLASEQLISLSFKRKSLVGIRVGGRKWGGSKPSVYLLIYLPPIVLWGINDHGIETLNNNTCKVGTSEY